ncbi:MmcQ/YjbR family DNA-binding protein [Saccharothrix syringae]|uniref:MmcQ/YjbR family DNA-binding protein n=1 Tax=Saccharothrix syringae TaxID=103733 RepID=A0A5Q0H3C8_SACSY|nr:MmcQ/YjbR family DNA-binding protein [Saccharothrix syringae]
MAVHAHDFFRLVDALADVDQAKGDQYTTLTVRGKRFGYYWPRTHTAGLKQTLSEQRALVAERPDVFEEQFTAGGFGWVVVHLDGIELDELSELVFEAWRLSAPEELVAEVPDWAEQPPLQARSRAGRSRSTGSPRRSAPPRPAR